VAGSPGSAINGCAPAWTDGSSSLGGVFSVNSLYRVLTIPSQPVINNKYIWKMKIPLKTEVFAWYLCRGVILTKDNVVKRNWHGCKK
jgi:hypothetical protein